jgi:hypothetical protein
MYVTRTGEDAMLARKSWLPHHNGVRLDERMIAWVQEQADGERMTVSRFVREILEREARRDLQRHTEVQGGDLSPVA